MPRPHADEYSLVFDLPQPEDPKKRPELPSVIIFVGESSMSMLLAEELENPRRLLDITIPAPPLYAPETAPMRDPLQTLLSLGLYEDRPDSRRRAKPRRPKKPGSLKRQKAARRIMRRHQKR
jgi:hypothetical protein